MKTIDAVLSVFCLAVMGDFVARLVIGAVRDYRIQQKWVSTIHTMCPRCEKAWMIALDEEGRVMSGAKGRWNDCVRHSQECNPKENFDD